MEEKDSNYKIPDKKDQAEVEQRKGVSAIEETDYYKLKKRLDTLEKEQNMLLKRRITELERQIGSIASDRYDFFDTVRRTVLSILVLGFVLWLIHDIAMAYIQAEIMKAAWA